mmetsp:Transcript_23293/g.58934  ORF Transcript_23293/g.58934 Transcript_23293/m.58934 type:complete len:392 (-) Transcript_23293:123-1298(-)
MQATCFASVLVPRMAEVSLQVRELGHGVVRVVVFFLVVLHVAHDVSVHLHLLHLFVAPPLLLVAPLLRVQRKRVQKPGGHEQVREDGRAAVHPILPQVAVDHGYVFERFGQKRAEGAAGHHGGVLLGEVETFRRHERVREVGGQHDRRAKRDQPGAALPYRRRRPRHPVNPQHHHSDQDKQEIQKHSEDVNPSRGHQDVAVAFHGVAEQGGHEGYSIPCLKVLQHSQKTAPLRDRERDDQRTYEFLQLDQGEGVDHPSVREALNVRRVLPRHELREHFGGPRPHRVDLGGQVALALDHHVYEQRAVPDRGRVHERKFDGSVVPLGAPEQSDVDCQAAELGDRERVEEVEPLRRLGLVLRKVLLAEGRILLLPIRHRFLSDSFDEKLVIVYT